MVQQEVMHEETVEFPEDLRKFVIPVMRLADRGVHGGSLRIGKKILVCENKFDLLPSVFSQCDAMLT